VTNQKRITNPGGVQVLFNGIPAPLVFASAGQAIGDCAVLPLAASNAGVPVLQLRMFHEA